MSSPIALHLTYLGRLSDEPSACQSDWSSKPAHSRDLPLKCRNYRLATTPTWHLCGAGVQGLALTVFMGSMLPTSHLPSPLFKFPIKET